MIMAIPKISISAGRKREKCVLDFDCSTTANFGAVQPIMAREMIPNSKFSVQSYSRVLAAAMPVPTFGRLYLKNTHVFVPYHQVCTQFDSFISKQPYVTANGFSYVPTELSPFYVKIFSQAVLARFADWTIYELNPNGLDTETTSYGYKPLLLPKTIDSTDQSAIQALADIRLAWNSITQLSSTPRNHYGKQYAEIRSAFSDVLPAAGPMTRGAGANRYGRLLLGDWYVSANNTVTGDDLKILVDSNPPTSDFSTSGNINANFDGSYVDIDSADFISTFGLNGKYTVAFKLTPYGKRIRSILIGLMYQFNPNVDSNPGNFLKLLAFYKAWFDVYNPKRDLSFTMTNCFKLIKQFEMEVIGTWNVAYTYQSGEIVGVSSDLVAFMEDLAKDCYAYLPQDYFTMAQLRPVSNYEANISSISFDTLDSTYSTIDIPSAESSSYPFGPLIDTALGGRLPYITQIGLKVLKYVNKNSIVGRSIKNYFKIHYNIDLPDSDDNSGVVIIGSDSVNIGVSEVMNAAATEEQNLGEYAGRGRGDSTSKKFTYENNKDFGVWITLSVIMPKSGYYQGILKENQARKPFDFFTSEFDSVGMQLLTRDELTVDYPVCTNSFLPNAYDFTKGYGFVPRYSHLKVGRNIVNGDLSLRGMANSMSGYTLDRVIPYQRINPTGFYRSQSGTLTPTGRLTAPYFLPTVVMESFRKVDPTDHLGNYNRIFYSLSNDEDHFIINNVFEVDAWLPALSLSDSFDTHTDEENEVQVQHA